MPEAHGKGLFPVMDKLLGGYEALNGVVVSARREVLADTQVQAPRFQKVGKKARYFAFFLPESEHDSRFGFQSGVKFVKHLQDPERTPVIGPFADMIKTRYGFEVVADDVGPGADNRCNAFPVTLKIGYEQFDPGVR